MYVEMNDPLTGAEWVYRVVANIQDRGHEYVLLQKVNLEENLELFRISAEDEEITAVEDEAEWERVVTVYEAAIKQDLAVP